MNIAFVTNMLSSLWRLLKTDKNNICVICLCSSLIIQNYWIFKSLCKFCIHTSDIFRLFYKSSMRSFFTQCPHKIDDLHIDDVFSLHIFHSTKQKNIMPIFIHVSCWKKKIQVKKVLCCNCLLKMFCSELKWTLCL